MKYSIGDCFYFSDQMGSVIFAEVYKVYEKECAYGYIEIKDKRYGSIAEADCFDCEKLAKVAGKEKRIEKNKKAEERKSERSKKSNLVKKSNKRTDK